MLKHIILILSLAAFWVSIPSFASSYFTTEEIKHEIKGHDAYKEGIKQFPQTWQNAHHIKNTNITFDENGNINLAVEISYENLGALSNGELRSAELSYQTKLTKTESVLPKFTDIVISPSAVGKATTFTSAYPANRLGSLAHYWFALIEDPSRNPKKWLAGPASQVTASKHKISDFSFIEQKANQYKITMNLDWNGILPNQAEMTAKTKHSWIVVDNKTERFARIKSIKVEIIEPFAIKK